MKIFLILRTAVFVVTALGVIDLMTGSGLNAAMRHGFGDVTNPPLIRTLVDMCQLVCLAILAVKQWSGNRTGALYIVTGIAFLILILPDLNSFLFLSDYNIIYYLILATFTFPVLVILYDDSRLLSVKPRHILIAALLIILSGFLYDLLVIGLPYQDPPQELIEKQMRHQQIVRWMWYWGMVCFAVGLMRIISGMKKVIP